MNSYAEIEAKEQEGTRNRTVAATQMNATSSRAHTIVAINFTQKAPNEAGESMTKQASINLVDLAGRYVRARLLTSQHWRNIPAMSLHDSIFCQKQVSWSVYVRTSFQKCRIGWRMKVAKSVQLLNI